MGKKTKFGKNRLDKFYHLAKEQGYRARSAFKLIQLNRKYNFLGKSRTCIDLCAAPGGWLQVAAKHMPVTSIIIGVDLVAIKPIRNVQTFVCDITTQKCRTDIKGALKDWTADVVLHDGAPNVGAQWEKDAYNQAELVLYALKLAVEFLSPDGTFVTKVFRSGDYNSLLYVFQQLFKKVEATKPQASRNTSAEIFVVCQGFLAPKKIDPKLLDPRSVFTQVEAPVSIKQYEQMFKDRQRGGYAEGNYTLFKKCPVSQFIEADDPIKMLVEYNVFEFSDEKSKSYEAHPLTSADIRGYCSDLRLMSKADFRRLLKWRLRMKDLDKIRLKVTAELMMKERGENGAEGSEDGEEKEEEDPRALIRKAVEAQEMKKERMMKHDKRKERKLRLKHQQRLALRMDAGADIHEGEQDMELFRLNSIKSKKGLDKVDEGDLSDTELRDSDDEYEGGGADDESEDSDAYSEMLDRTLDNMYESYLLRRNARAVEGDREAYNEKKAKKEDKVVSFMGAEQGGSDDEDQESNPLLSADKAEQTAVATKRAAQWFSNPMFAGLDEDDDENTIKRMADTAFKRVKENSDASEKKSKKSSSSKSVKSEEDDGKPSTSVGKDLGKRKRAGDEDMGASDEEQDSDDYEDMESGDEDALFDDEEEYDNENAIQSAEESSHSESEPHGADEESSSSDDVSTDEDQFSDVSDIDERSRLLALGQEMRSKRKRYDIIDDSFNRYAMDDNEDLPRWFLDDVRANSHIQLPVTKEQVQLYKDRLRAIDARPIKKVMEANARKKRKQQRVMERMQSRMGEVADNDELTPNAKAREMEKLYAKANKTKNKHLPPRIVVNNKGGHASEAQHKGGGKTGKTKVVDARMKSDMRGMAKSAARGKSSRAGKSKSSKKSRK